MSKIANIERIHSIAVHPDADTLLIAKVLQWPVVIKKDAGYKDGDLVVFIFPDSIVDKENPHFAFMEKMKWRTWMAKFRKQPSAGLVMPISIALERGLKLEDAKEGLDVAELLKITHYEKPLDITVSGEAKGNFPTKHLAITDEDNLLSYPEVLNEFTGLNCYLSLKMDGSSLSVIRYNDEEHVCSRRLSLKEGDSAFWRAEKKYNILQKIRDKKLNVGIQAELVGPKMNGNKLGLTDIDIAVFNVRDLDTGEYAGFAGIRNFCAELGLPMVPVIQEFRFDETWTLERLREIANNVRYPNGAAGEGIVLRPVLSRYSPTLNKMLSVKVINSNYKE